MRTLYQTVFTGPTEAQYAKIKADEDANKEYMRWLHNEGKGSDLEACEAKYAELMKLAKRSL